MQAEMSSDSYQLQGMSERGFLPSLFNKRRWAVWSVWSVCSAVRWGWVEGRGERWPGVR